MRRLYQKIFLTIIASLVVVVLIAGAFWRYGPENSRLAPVIAIAGELAALTLPEADAPREEQRRALERIGRRLNLDITLFDSSLSPIASAGPPLPAPRYRDGVGWVRGPGGSAAWSVPLPDGRWIVVRPPPHHQPPAIGFVVFLVLLGAVVALGAYPVVRGLTRRLERLRAGVDTLGAGNLAARVKVEGRDEIAGLAESFNRAAGRIEQLVGAHRLLLANASHELRTPLSRIRLGLELFLEKRDPAYKEALQRDIAELDGLIDEILLASRLDANMAQHTTEDVDLLALAAEECARYDGCTLDGVAAAVRGDPRLLRRMIRNLLENASRHGEPPVRVELRRDGARAVLEVIDAGAGVPEAERERVFTPFHRLGRETAGAGLGLSLVRQIARLHGGDAVIAARPDAASCFRVSLPAVAG
jgi:signal transduction histidine kinase